MKTQILSWFAVTLLVAGGCSDRASGTPGRLGGGMAGAAGNAAGGPDPAWSTPPAVGAALAVPPGATLTLHAHAEGAQIYTCTASGGGAADATYAWVLKAPDARLYDATGAQIGTHGAGPSWTSSDGSVATGMKLAELPSPLPDAIAWLLLRASSTSGVGALGGVTYVQRLSTTGGVAPASGCDATTVGAEVREGYTAEYYFYGGGDSTWPPLP
jgi:hypothetical protein